jgi:hypothetical protein
VGPELGRVGLASRTSPGIARCDAKRVRQSGWKRGGLMRGGGDGGEKRETEAAFSVKSEERSDWEEISEVPCSAWS